MNILERFYDSKSAYDDCIGKADTVTPDLVRLIIEVAHAPGITDRDYMSTLEQFHLNGPIEDLHWVLNLPASRDPKLLCALLTFIVRRDRFSCGTGETLIELIVDGSISKLIEMMKDAFPADSIISC